MRAKVDQNVRDRMTCRFYTCTHTGIQCIYRRDKLKHQKGRGIIIFKEEMERIRLLDQQLHVSHVIEVPNLL